MSDKHYKFLNNKKNHKDINKISDKSKELLESLESKPKKIDNRKLEESNQEDTSWLSARTFLGILLLGAIGYGGIQAGNKLNTYLLNEEKKGSNTTAVQREQTTSTNKTKVAPQQEAKFTKLSGEVGYPSDWIPNMKICRVNTNNKQETCQTLPSSEQAYEYEIDLPSPGSYWVYWSTKVLAKKNWVGNCTPNRMGNCEEFIVTAFKAHPGVKRIPNINIGTDWRFHSAKNTRFGS